MPKAEDGGSAPAAPAALSPVALDSLLAASIEDTSERDRAARRHGQAVLRVLARLQGLLLGSGDAAATLAELRHLATAMPEASDPALAVALDQVVLRARIELARYHG